MGRAADAERLKHLTKRIAAVRTELGALRAERDAVLARLRTIPGKVPSEGRMAVRVAYGADGEGVLLVDLPAKGRAVASGDQSTRAAFATPESAIDPDAEDR